jgi:hypothetical protein
MQTLCADKDDKRAQRAQTKRNIVSLGRRRSLHCIRLYWNLLPRARFNIFAMEWVSAWLERWSSYAEGLLVIGITLQMCHKCSRTRKPTIASSQVRYITHVRTPDRKTLFPTYSSKTRNQNSTNCSPHNTSTQQTPHSAPVTRTCPQFPFPTTYPSDPVPIACELTTNGGGFALQSAPDAIK